jgi:uncharacterized peroxidase-related enzyme
LDDLRGEVRDKGDVEREAWLARLRADWRSAGLDPIDAALCAYAEKLTRTPARMEAGDIAALRAVGLDDVAIHEALQVVAYFNYINRIADAIHVDLEADMEPYPR